MILRLALAYGVVQAGVGAVAIVLAGALLGQHTIGITRQPLPLVWLLGVLLVVAAQLPLQSILPPTEWTATRAVPTRMLRAAFALMIVEAASASGVHRDPALDVLVFLLLAVAFVAAGVTRVGAWSWPLGLGMAWVAVQSVTALGVAMVSFLNTCGVGPAVAIAILAALFYVMTDLPLAARLSRVRPRLRSGAR